MPTDDTPISEVNGAFRVTALGADGLSREAARGPRFAAPSRGVRYRVDHADPRLARHTAAVLGSSGHAILAGLSAAQAWGLPTPPWIGLEWANRPVSVAVGDGNRPRRGDVEGHRLLLPTGHVTHFQGVRLTTPARTWLDCAASIPLPHAVAMGDAVLAQGLASQEDLAAIVSWAKRRRGVVAARRAGALLDERSASPGESLARAHLVLGGVAAPVCNHDVIVNGEWIARVDLAWLAARLAVEYDGEVHLTEVRRRHDAARRNLLQAAGWQVITLTAADLGRPWAMVSLVRAAIVERTPPPPPRHRRR
ncbi:MAG: DUF559 domain-containing protein [Actinomycetota bacterium]|nr:DUF559 domain-containing protein [Actinomycetota bacterium]